MKNMSRSIRRHHAKRLKTNRRSYWSNFKKTERQLGLLLNTPKLLQCFCCSNARKNLGKPFSELRLQQKELHSYED